MQISSSMKKQACRGSWNFAGYRGLQPGEKDAIEMLTGHLFLRNFMRPG